MSERKLLEAQFALEYQADFSSRYHRRRAAFLIKLDRLLTILVLTSGAGAFVNIMQQGAKELGYFAALSVTAISLIQVVFEIGLAGAKHSEWLRRWDKLATDIQCHPRPNEDDIKRWRVEKSSLETECVAEVRALAVACENDARSARGIQEGQREINYLQRLFIQFGTFQQKFSPVKVPSPSLPERSEGKR